MKPLAALLLLATVASAADALELLQEALKRLELLDKEGAEQALTQALALEPRLASAYLARGRLREHMGLIEGAARDFECVCRLGADMWRHAAELYERASAYDEAANACEESWRRSGKLEDLVALAEARARAGDLEGALLAYNEILKRVESHSAVPHLAQRGRIKSALGMHEEGAADLDLAIQRIPRYSRAYWYRGRIRIRQGHIQEGIADHLRALDQASADASSHFVMGAAYYDTADWVNAAATLERCIAFEDGVPEYAHVYLFLARCRTGEPAKRMQAARELTQFLEGRRERDDWLAKVGAFLTGSLDEEDFLAAASVGNKHLCREHQCEAHAYIAARCMLTGDRERARDHFRQALATRVCSYVEYNTAEAEMTRLGER